MKIREDDKWKTAFRAYYSYFKYQVMFFGLTNIQVTFQGYINKILTEKLDVLVIVYFDDIFIYIKSKGKKHIEAI